MMSVLLTTMGVAQPSRHLFGAEGGSFGRSQKCDWVLADPQCILSSVHGRISLVSGTFILVDDSTNGIFIENSFEALGRGNSVILHDGLKFRAGGYQIEARLVQGKAERAAVTPPAAQTQPVGWAAPDERRADAALRQREDYGDLWGSRSQDPLAYLDGGSSDSVDAGRASVPIPAPFQPALRPVDPLMGLPMQADHSSLQAIPPTFASLDVPRSDPFGLSPHPIEQRAALPEDLLAPVAARSQMPAPLPAVSLASSKLIPDDFDPFRSLGAFGAKSAVPEPRQVGNPVLPTSADRMPPMPSVEPMLPVEPVRPAVPLSAALLADVVRIDPPVASERRVVAVEKAAFDPMEALRSRREERTAALQRKAEDQARAPAMVFPETAGSVLQPNATDLADADLFGSLPPVARDAVLRALLRGMGFPDAKFSASGGEKLAEDVGAMVRAIAEGLVQLLSARQLLKSEFRMDETQIRPEENNPFKYFKIAELALDELFLTRSGGFQAPAEAAASAFADVQQHVMLTTAAMQRAMTLMFERLSPDIITRGADADGGMRIRGLGVGKGKWETYVDNHTRMSGQIDGIARQIISEAFAQVQEEQARKASTTYWEKKT
jgi:FHA domain-containing protein